MASSGIAIEGKDKMKSKFILATLAATISTTAIVPEAALARDYNNRVYHGHHYRHYRCKTSSGTTGLVLGAVGGGLAGSALGGGTLGTVLGAGGGALLGRHLDKRHDAAQNRRNGC
jgi:uncharacterized protein YcfJ